MTNKVCLLTPPKLLPWVNIKFRDGVWIAFWYDCLSGTYIISCSTSLASFSRHFTGIWLFNTIHVSHQRNRGNWLSCSVTAIALLKWLSAYRFLLMIIVLSWQYLLRVRFVAGIWFSLWFVRCKDSFYTNSFINETVIKETAEIGKATLF